MPLPLSYTHNTRLERPSARRWQYPRYRFRQRPSVASQALHVPLIVGHLRYPGWGLGTHSPDEPPARVNLPSWPVERNETPRGVSPEMGFFLLRWWAGDTVCAAGGLDGPWGFGGKVRGRPALGRASCQWFSYLLPIPTSSVHTT